MVVLFALVGSERATAQHTLTLTGGTGVSTARFYPAEETKWMWWTDTYGISSPKSVPPERVGSFWGGDGRGLA